MPTTPESKGTSAKETQPKQGLELLESYAQKLPEKPGVYLFKNSRDDIVYVGKAKRLKRRVLSYVRLDQLPLRKQRMILNLAGIDVILTSTETEALLLEANLIKKHRPACNVILKDDKSFPYLHLTGDHPYPQLKIYRGRRTEKGSYFGPFPGKNMVYETYETLQRLFLVRTCKDSVFHNRSRPCLLYDIKRCSAPCVGKISPEAYQELLQQMVRFFKGQTQNIQENLAQQMRQASQEQAYEKAIVLRDRIRALTKVQERQAIHLPDQEDIHVHALVREGGKVCIQVGFYQAGQHYGSRAYFPGHVHDDDTNEDIIATFLSQFYEGHTPAPLLLTNCTPSHQELLENVLHQQLGRRVHIKMPKTGPKKEALTLVENAGRHALTQLLASLETHQQGLKKLAQLLGLPSLPRRIETYDNSHLFGENPYGVMVVADSEGMAKNAYRKYSIKDTTIKPNDDFAMMRHVMQRRFSGSSPSENTRPSMDSATSWPCVMLIDGGIGQVNAVKEFFQTNAATLSAMSRAENRPLPRLIGIAKGPQRNAVEETLYLDTGEVLKLDKASPLLYFLQRLRDEAHRFAITTHRTKRDKKIRRSVLDDVPGIGPKRKKALLNHFGSTQEITQASVAALQKVEGINASTAQQIYDWFHTEE